MNQLEYQQAIRTVLARSTEKAKGRIEAISPKIPPSAKQALVTVYIDQDGEGLLDIRMQLDGPDLYVLNKAIKECASIFETRFTDGGLSSGLPLMEPDTYEFSVHHTLADCAVTWIVSLWEGIDHTLFTIPVLIDVHDDYGTLAPVALKK